MKETKKTSENQPVKPSKPDTQAPEAAEKATSADTLSAKEAPVEPTEPAETDKVAEPVKEPCAECVQWQDKYARLSAEFDNFRKRTLKEKLELIASGGEAVWKAILPVADDFERAIKAMSEREGTPDVDLEGVKLIFQKLQEAMRGAGVTPIVALGQKMNVDFFDAVAKVPAPAEDQKGVVMDVVQTGYMLGDKVLRFAKVVVGE